MWTGWGNEGMAHPPPQQMPAPTQNPALPVHPSGGGVGSGNYNLDSLCRTQQPTPIQSDILMSLGITAYPAPYDKEWQNHFSFTERSKLVCKMAAYIIHPFPITPGEPLDKRVCSVIGYVTSFEKNMFVAANSPGIYIDVLAAKALKIRDVLKEKRRQRMVLAQQQAQSLIQSQIGNEPPSVQPAQPTLHSPNVRPLLLIVNHQPLVTQPAVTICQLPGPSAGRPTLSAPITEDTPMQIDTTPVIEPKNEPGVTMQTSSTVEPMDTSNRTDNTIVPAPLGQKKNDELVLPAMTQNRDNALGPLPTTQTQMEPLKPEELKRVLRPVLNRLFEQLPESAPFHTPVSPHALDISDYFDIIKNPMDLSTIRGKLEGGGYSDPWEFIDDVWLTFENARKYNPETNLVHKYSTKMSKLFGTRIEPVMQTLGYCCGQKRRFTPEKLFCYGKEHCSIPRGANYFSNANKYKYCEKCFNQIAGDTVIVVNIDDISAPSVSIPKSEFVKMKNEQVEPEPFVSCSDCCRRHHRICVLHVDEIWPEGFTCDSCRMAKGETRKNNKFTAKELPQTKLGTFIEKRVDAFLKFKSPGAGKVHIRVVSSSEKLVEVKPGMKRKFAEAGSSVDAFPYTSKALFAFQEIDGTEVCFFGMHVQEYGSGCPLPNCRRVYVAYLDSVHFFKPKEVRTAVYHQILLGYLDYAKRIGYTHAHIWASPPVEGEDYIFHCHPPEQKIPKTKRLQDWYRRLLDRGVIDRIVLDYKDILNQAADDKISSAVELPYFDGDFWPNTLELALKEIEEEAAFKASGKKPKMSNRSTTVRRTGRKKSCTLQTNDPLLAKISPTMENVKDTFFVIRLHSAQTAESLRVTQDPDPISTCEMMDGRDGFLTMSRTNHCEFSSLRRAKYSTMVMLHELHTQQFVYSCDGCGKTVEGMRYHCAECDETKDSYDLCVDCFQKTGHRHKMEKIGVNSDGRPGVPENGTGVNSDGGLGSGGPENGICAASGSPKKIKPEPGSFTGNLNTSNQDAEFERLIRLLVQATRCKDGNGNCVSSSCKKMKTIIAHLKVCGLERKKGNPACHTCRQLINLVSVHEKKCKTRRNCPVPMCSYMKEKRIKMYEDYVARQHQQLRDNGMQPGMGIQENNHSSAQIVPSQGPQNQQVPNPELPPIVSGSITPPFGIASKPGAVNNLTGNFQGGGGNL